MAHEGVEVEQVHY